MTKKTADDAGLQFSHLLALMAHLRSESGCPWDREQTHASLKRYLLEETYELLDAIDTDNDDALIEELGDVLLQVVFHAQIASETGRFSMADVVGALADKLVRRHPHVFGDDQAEDADAVLRTWHEVKRKERRPGESEDGAMASLLASIPRALPALMEAEKVQARAARVGFQWDDVDGAWQKVHEELGELHEAVRDMTSPRDNNPSAGTGPEALRKAASAELGDALFALVNVARYLDIDPEQSLRAANDKFRRRFAYIEEEAAAQGRRLEDMTLAEMDDLWNEAKRQGRG